jgi:orotate phosphoribosyltransferase
MVHTARMHGLIREVYEAGLISDGNFEFRSGLRARKLLDRDRLLSDTHLASRMGYSIAKHFFLSRTDVVATPSVWGAGLAQWVGFYFDPPRPVVYPTPSNGGVTLSDSAREMINERRVLVVDNLILSGKTVQEFVRAIAASGGKVIGIAALADLSGIEFPLPVFGLLNEWLDVYDPRKEPERGADEPVTHVGY